MAINGAALVGFLWLSQGAMTKVSFRRKGGQQEQKPRAHIFKCKREAETANWEWGGGFNANRVSSPFWGGRVMKRMRFGLSTPSSLILCKIDNFHMLLDMKISLYLQDLRHAF